MALEAPPFRGCLRDPVAAWADLYICSQMLQPLDIMSNFLCQLITQMRHWEEGWEVSGGHGKDLWSRKVEFETPGITQKLESP